MTAHQQGLKNIQKSTTAEMITMGNRTQEAATVVGNLPGIICDQYGNELNRVKIQDVSYLPNRSFNLFSLTQMTSKGWNLGENGEAIWIEKDSKKVVFDLMIPTPKGVLFAMYFARDTEVAGTVSDIPIKTVTI
jgi:hypothetical protein